MLMVVLLASTAPFRTASAMSSCRGTLLGRRMSGIRPYSGWDVAELWDHGTFTDLSQRWLNFLTVQSSVILPCFYILHIDTDYFTMQKCLNATQERGK